MNGGPLHPMNGAPLRLVIPGWPGSCSQKWLTRIRLRDVVHDGPKMTGSSYRVPATPVAPGEKVPDGAMTIIHSMPVKSLITAPRTAWSITGRTLPVAGHAWAGEGEVARVDVSIDFGATWQPAQLGGPVNRHAWQRWSATLEFPREGYYEVWARAADDKETSQPFAVAWNPKGISTTRCTGSRCAWADSAARPLSPPPPPSSAGSHPADTPAGPGSRSALPAGSVPAPAGIACPGCSGRCRSWRARGRGGS